MLYTSPHLRRKLFASNDLSELDAMPFMTNDERSFLVILSAHALGSLGFGLSILAIWIGWFMPAAPVAADTQAHPRMPQRIDKDRRRSAPPALPAPSSVSSPPRRPITSVPLSPILSSRSDESPLSSCDRHVYFVDSGRPYASRRSTLPADLYGNDLFKGASSSRTAQESSVLRPSSPASTISTDATSSIVVEPSPYTKIIISEAYDEVTPESDSSRQSSRASLPLCSRMPRVKINFHNKGKRNPLMDSKLSPVVDSPNVEIQRSNSMSAACSPVHRSQTAPDILSPKPISSARLALNRCLSPRPNTRPATAPSPLTPLTPLTPAPTSSPSNSFFRRPQRRTSVPVRRTLPYEAPYFASPPLAFDEESSYTTCLRGRLQFEEDVMIRAAASDDERLGSPRKHEQQSSRTGRQRPVPKRRSASAGLVERSTPRSHDIKSRT